MATVLFDTLALARKLEDTGMPREQAQGVAAALAETLSEQLVSRRDLAEFEARLAARFGSIDGRFERIEGRFERIDERFERVDERFDTLERSLRAEIREAEQRTTIRLGGMLAASVAVTAALVKLL